MSGALKDELLECISCDTSARATRVGVLLQNLLVKEIDRPFVFGGVKKFTAKKSSNAACFMFTRTFRVSVLPHLGHRWALSFVVGMEHHLHWRMLKLLEPMRLRPHLRTASTRAEYNEAVGLPWAVESVGGVAWIWARP